MRYDAAMMPRLSALLLLLTLSCKGDEDDAGPGDQCPALCDKLSTCGDPSADTCASTCAAEGEPYDYIGAGCRAIYDEYNLCRTDLGCGDLQTDAGPTPCSDIREQLYTSERCTTDLCDRHADRVVECGLVAPEYRQNHALECSSAIAETVAVGPDCTAKSEALYECILALSCAQIDAADGCDAEEDAQNIACDY